MSFIGNSPKVNRLRLNPRSTDPVNPTDGDLQYADGSAREEGLWVYKNSAWVRAGSSEDSGVKNYISQTDSLFEGGIGTWFTFDDGSAYVDGTGGTASNLTISTTANPAQVLEGTASFSIAKAAADAQYEGTSVQLIDIDRADLGRTLYGSLEFDSSQDADYASGDLKIFAYDITNSIILPVLTDDDGIPAGKGKVLFRILPSTTTEQIRLSLMVNSSNAAAWEVFVDEVIATPAAQIEAPIVTPWESFTPTTSWGSNVTFTARKRRVGDSLEIRLSGALTGAPTSATFELTVPDSLSIDLAKMQASGGIGAGAKVGDGYLWDESTAANRTYGQVIAQTSTTLRITATANGSVTQAVPFTWANGDFINLVCSIPIEGWNASAVLSTTEASNETGKFRASRNGTAQTGISTNNSFVQLLFNSTSGNLDYSSGLVYDDANARFVVVQPGVYTFSASAFINSTNVLASRYELIIQQNGSNRIGSTSVFPVATVSFQLSASGDLQAEAGDIITVGIFGLGNNSVNTLTMAGSSTLSYFTGHQLPDFTVFGVYGEQELLEATAAAANFTTTVTEYADAASLVLTPGEWDIEAVITYISNGATTTTNVYAGISSTSGNSATGLTEGNTLLRDVKNTAVSTRTNLQPFVKGVVVSSPTAYYLKMRADGSNTNLQYAYKISARRVR